MIMTTRTTTPTPLREIAVAEAVLAGNDRQALLNRGCSPGAACWR